MVRILQDGEWTVVLVTTSGGNDRRKKKDIGRMGRRDQWRQRWRRMGENEECSFLISRQMTLFLGGNLRRNWTQKFYLKLKLKIRMKM